MTTNTLSLMPLKVRTIRQQWLAMVLLALAPLWLMGMFERGYWTPDEPREADIAWRMSQQSDLQLPQLATQPFLEKPPLSYWMSAASLKLFGASPAAMRAPNLLYALLTAMAIGVLAYSMAGRIAAIVAALFTGSAFTAYQVSIWLAPDACLLAGCAITLLGLYRGYVASSSKQKLLWYCLMHIGAAIGFMAKSGPGWIYPGVTLLMLIVWEQRWRELLRWQLWAGFGIQLVVIGTWVYMIWRRPDGLADLRILFWNNLVGRFTDLHASGALDYTAAHQNWFGKYFVELLYDLFPWSLLAAAALRRAVTTTQMQSPQRTAWRCAIASSLPFMILLSFAATARSIYIAPSILGFGLLTALWASELHHSGSTSADRINLLALSWTRYLVAALAAVVLLIILFIAFAIHQPRSALLLVISGIAMIILVTLALIQASSYQQRAELHRSLGFTFVAFALCLCVSSHALNPVIDSWQDLGSLAHAINVDTKDKALAVIRPDETTIAMMDYQLGTSMQSLDGSDAEVTDKVIKWFILHPVTGRILIMLPGHAPSELTQLINRFETQKPQNDGQLTALQNAHTARLIARYESPNGRRYAVIGPMTTTPAS